MSIKVIVFDFDGTLIDSNRLKYDAYFELFPDDEGHTRLIEEVLSELYEQSRYVILEKIIRRLCQKVETDLTRKINELADRYNSIVLNGAKICPPMPDAQMVLGSLSRRYRMYLSSTTPQAALKEIVRDRGWNGFFEDIFGYPHQKSKTLQQVMAIENIKASEMIVIGDGESDRQSAMENRCPFVHVTEKFRLKELEGMIATFQQQK